jgi:hypothetical protein
MAESVKIEPVKGEDNVVKVTMVITIGKVMAMNNALKFYSEVSTVAFDLATMIDSAEREYYKKINHERGER